MLSETLRRQLEELLARPEGPQLHLDELLGAASLAAEEKVEFLLCLADLQRQHQDPGAGEHYVKAYHLALAHNARPLEIKALQGLEELALTEGRIEELIRLLRQELSLWYSGMPSYFSSLSRNFRWQARAFLRLNDYNEAGLYDRHAVTFAVTAGDLAAEAQARTAQAERLALQERQKESLRQYRVASDCYRRAGMQEQAEALFALSQKKHRKENDHV